MNITFLNLPPFHVVLFLFLIAGFFIFYSYREFSVLTHFKTRVILATIRAVLLLLIFFIALDPYWKKRGRSDWMGVLVDSSESMGVVDKGAEASRLEILKTRLNKSRYWKKLNKDSIQKLYGFDEDLWPLSAIHEVQASESETNFLGALEELNHLYRSDQRLIGWIVFSDGGATDSGGPAKEILQNMAFPLIVIQTGQEGEVSNLTLEAPELKDPIFAGELIKPELKWISNYPPETAADLKIELDGKPLLQKRILLKEKKFEFEFSLTDAGRHVLNMSLGPLEGEGSTKDNHIEMAFIARPRTVHVFYAESFYKDKNYFKLGLEEDRDFEVNFATSLIGFARKHSVPFFKDPLYGFPPTREDLMRYDVVILSDVKRRLLSNEQIDWIRELVEEGGGAFVMIGGVDSFGDGGYVKTPIEGLLPVEISEEYKGNAHLKARGVNANPFQPVLVRGAEEHPAVRLAEDKALNAELWKTIPQLGGYNYVGRLKPGAEMLLRHPVDEGTFGPRVILAVQSYGKGKAMAFTSDVTPNWGENFQGWRREKEGWLYAQFWQKALKWLTENRLRIKTSPLEIKHKPQFIETGQDIYWKILLPTSLVETDAVLIFEIFRKDQKIRSETFKTFHGNIVEWKIAAPEPGEYQYTVSLLRKDKEPFSQDGLFSVYPSRTESRNLNVNPALLKSLARESEGVYLHLQELDRLDKAIKKISKVSLRRHSVPFWNHGRLYVIIIGLFCLDWFIRKKKGLE